MIQRYDIINICINKRFPNNCKYLEIGVRNPEDCFDKIRATEKTSVDSCVDRGAKKPDYEMTSDAFFEALFSGKTKLPADYKWDVIFIDGLHLAYQVFADLQNSLKCISQNGLIFLHDCSPENWTEAHSDHEFALNNPYSWNGTTWKALYYARTVLPYKIVTVNQDYGVGIVDISQPATPIEHTNKFFDYGIMKSNRKHFLGLISVEEFVQQYSMSALYDNWSGGFYRSR